MSNFTGLHIGLSGIRAGQTGFETAADSVANANTPGYTRQRAAFDRQDISDEAWGVETELTGVDDTDRAEDLLDLQIQEMVLLSVLDHMPRALPRSLTTFLR